MCLAGPVAPCRAGATDVIGGIPFAKPFPDGSPEALPFSYARVKSAGLPVYRKPEDEANGVAPVRLTRQGFIWVSLSDSTPVFVQGHNWYRINEGEYLRADFLRIAQPSRFQGVLVPRHFDKDFAWLIFDTRISSAPGKPPGESAVLLPERTLVIIYAMVGKGNRAWYRIDGGWVPYRRIALLKRRPRPSGVNKTEPWIDVNLSEQTLAAYEGDRLVFATMISAGVDRYPTAQGLFRIWAKARRKRMSGGENETDRYVLEDVPWQMYYYKSYGLHAAYWHDLFGLSTSSGCINLSPPDALWLYRWTRPRPRKGVNWQEATREDPGTWVWVHE